MSNKKNFVSRFAGKGYYIALILCAIAIGISGYLYYQNANDEPASMDHPSPTLDVLNPDPTMGTNDLRPVEPKPEPTTPPKKPLKFSRPLSGKLVMDYSMDCLCYNPTTRDWRTHDGMDFAAQAGTPVCASADGVVYTVYEDETMGKTVVIRHADGYVTTYASLDVNVKVAPGDQVTMGQTIGYVGHTALLETELGDHVHFAVTCNGKNVDPEDLFGKE